MTISLEANGIDGVLFTRILKGALQWLGLHRREVDALNVFPVPDGDTGSNMQATLEAAVAAISDPPPRQIGAAAESAARGALLGARGNSGVILSQVIQGFAVALKEIERASVQDIADALVSGTKLAYRAVSSPVEGTILTVLKDTAQEACSTAHRSQNPLRLITYILKAATRSLAQTPELLPLLKEAGVVDAGGRGFTAILEGAFRVATEKHARVGREFELPDNTERGDIPGAAGKAASSFASKKEETINFTYCTEFLLKSVQPDTTDLKETLAPCGDCLMVVGEGDLLRIHIHTDHPGIVLEEGIKRGTLHNIRISNMRDQHQEANEEYSGTAVVAVCIGEGFNALFANLGASTVPGGQTMNPSTGEITAAVEGTRAKDVIILPNNSNVILTARQVQDITGRTVEVIPTTTMPQGLSALLAFDPAAGAAANSSRMKTAAERVVTSEVTRAVRTAKIGDREVSEGEIIALRGDDLIAAGDDLNGVVEKAAMDIVPGRDVLTLFYGKDVDTGAAEALAARLTEMLPEVELELQYGGQPFYFYLIAAE
ncbi:MAG: DAK2 domain-containing protein [Bacillota bacterium]